MLKETSKLSTEGLNVDRESLLVTSEGSELQTDRAEHRNCVFTRQKKVVKAGM